MFEFFKRLFRKRAIEQKPEKEIEPKKLEENRPQVAKSYEMVREASYSTPKWIEQKQRNKPTILVTEKEIVKTKGPEEQISDFKKALNHLEKNRDEVLKEQQEEMLVLVPSANPDLKFIKFKKILFCFDNGGFDLFQEEFNIQPYELSIKREVCKNGEEAVYLVRENNDTGKIDFFHRWLMKKEIEDFCLEHNCQEREVVVHHTTFNPTINLKNNLQVMTKTEHNNLHHRNESVS